MYAGYSEYGCRVKITVKTIVNVHVVSNDFKCNKNTHRMMLLYILICSFSLSTAFQQLPWGKILHEPSRSKINK